MSLTEQDIFKLCVKQPLFTAETHNSLYKTGKPLQGSSQGTQLHGTGQNGSIENKDVQRYCLKLFLKVWNGFCKFLNHQILSNRCINTIHIGKFLRSQKFAGICYIPSTLFLDSSKLIFKEDSEYNLNPFTEIKVRTVQVSQTSLGQVCNAPKQTVSAILKEIFHKIAEKGRSGMELKIDIRIGTIHIQNGELQFVNLGGADGIFRASFDGHARALSQDGSEFSRTMGAGGAIRKGSHSIIASSVATPMTNITRSSRMSDGASHFADYINASNPNPQYGKNKYQTLSFDSGKTSPNIPWPHLSGFIEAGVPKREGKRVNVNPKMSRRQLLEQYLRNMKENQKKKFIQKQFIKNEDENMIKNLRENIVLDSYLRNAAENRRKQQFLSFNGASKDRHEQQRDNDLRQKKLQRYDYFPFTHGAQIQRRQKQLNENRRKQMKSKLQDGDFASSKNHFKNYSTGDASEISLTEGNPRAMPLSFYADYPVFLKPHKHYPYRRMKDNHVQDVMNDALQRYEKQLLSLQDQKKRDAVQFQNKLNDEAKRMKEKEDAAKRMLSENKGILMKQMQFEREKKKLDREAKKQLLRTNFGPEETDGTQGVHSHKRAQQTGQIKEELLNQIVQKQAKKKAELTKNRMQEVEQLISAAQVMQKERNEQIDKEAQSKLLNQNAWREQMKLNDIKKKIERRFNS